MGTDYTARRLRDRIAPGVRVLFVGINPGIRSAETGHHFAGYSNRFWKLLYEAGLVPARITPEDDDRLPGWGYGITNIVARPTRGIDEIRPDEYRAGARVLLRKIRRYRPPTVALVGVTVWRALVAATGGPPARPVTLGVQDLASVAPGLAGALPPGTRLVVLPNPSGRNATVSDAAMLTAFRSLGPPVGVRRGRRSPGRRADKLAP